jgi:hypothetical protein
MRVRVTNEGRREGSLLVDPGDDEDERPLRLRKLAAGSSVEVRMTQRGRIVAVGFRARFEPMPRRDPQAGNPTKNKPRKKEVKAHVRRQSRPH